MNKNIIILFLVALFGFGSLVLDQMTFQIEKKIVDLEKKETEILLKLKTKKRYLEKGQRIYR